MSYKVLQLQSSSGFYGAEKMLAQLSSALQDSPFKPIIGAINNFKTPHLELIQFAHQHRIDAKTFDCRSAWDRQTVRSLRQFLRDEKIDIIQTHGYKANFYALLATRRLATKRLATCHPWIINGWRSRSYAEIDKKVLQRFDHLVAVSDTVHQDLIKSHLPEQGITVIHNGIEADRFAKTRDRSGLFEKYNLAPGTSIIGCVGRLEPEKGQEILLQACRMLPRKKGWALFLAGHGSQKEKLMDASRKLGIDRQVHFLGYVDHIPTFLAQLDIFVLPSWTEGTPMALLEAMAAELAIVASAVGQVPALIPHKECGLLVAPGNDQELAAAIGSVIDNPIEAQRMARRAADRVAKDFNAREMADRYIALYRSLIESDKAR